MAPTMDFIVHYGTHDGTPYFNVTDPWFQPLRNPRQIGLALGLDTSADDLVKVANAGKYPHFSPQVRKRPAELWSAAEAAAAAREMPAYDVKGPEKRALCSQEHDLVGKKSLLIRSDYNVRTLKEASARCDSTPGCTHFSWTGESKLKMPYDPIEGSPFRVDLCRGPVVVRDYKNMNGFVGIRKGTPARADPLAGMDFNGPVPGLQTRTMPRTAIRQTPAEVVGLAYLCPRDDSAVCLESGEQREKWRSFI